MVNVVDNIVRDWSWEVTVQAPGYPEEPYPDMYGTFRGTRAQAGLHAARKFIFPKYILDRAEAQRWDDRAKCLTLTFKASETVWRVKYISLRDRVRTPGGIPVPLEDVPDR